MSTQKQVPFARQLREAEKAIADVFANTNVLREATRNAMVQLKEECEEYIAALDEDEANGVKDESQLKQP